MINTHRVFLIWLLYAVNVILLAAGLYYLGIPQLALAFDHSHLTLLLGIVYLLAEVMAGVQVWRLSQEHRVAQDAAFWLDFHGVDKITTFDTHVEISSRIENTVLDIDKDTVTGHHILNLLPKSRSPQRIDQSILLNLAEDELYDKVSLADFLGERIVWVGIFATILGVIMAFWPLLTSGFSIEMMRNSLGTFFGGIAVAFIPTAASFLFKIALDFNTRIVDRGVAETMAAITKLSEVQIIPYLEELRG